MTQWHAQSERKPSGGVRHTKRRCDKKLAWKGGIFAATTIGEKNIDVFRTRGGNEKIALLATRKANLLLPGGKAQSAQILAVVENRADRQYARQNIITKGAVLKVDAGGKQEYALVTSKPGQSGSVDAILLENYAENKENKENKAKPRPKPKKEAETAPQTATEEKTPAKPAEGKTPEKKH